MAIIISNIKVGLAEDQEQCYQRALDRLGVPASRVLKQYVVKKSVDARKQDQISFIYTVGLELCDEEAIPLGGDVRLQTAPKLVMTPGSKPLEHRPVVVGFGPAGMFCGLLLARNGYRPLILERGWAMPKRVRDVENFFKAGALCEESNVQFGEGGAGTFSDGKLTTRINDPRCDYILREFVRFGGPEELLQEAKPHIGTDKLRAVVVNLRKEIEALGGEIRFGTKVDGLVCENGHIAGVTAGGETIATENLVLAVGHSARDVFAMLHSQGVALEAKPFSVGVRIEHLQSDIDKGLYGKQAGNPLLPKGEYQLSKRNQQEQAVYTFCMCPGGVVVPAASAKDTIVTNGMSYYLRDGKNANAALVASVDSRDFGEDPMAAIRFQEELEHRAFTLTGSYKAPGQTVDRFLAGKPGYHQGRVAPTYAIGVAEADFSKLFSPRILEQLRMGIRVFSQRLPSFGLGDSFLTGPETRTSSPVRILREENLQTPSAGGLYPCGEGGGYAGGIMSAAADGLRVAEQIIKDYKPFA